MSERFELFHRLPDPASAGIRRAVTDLGLLDRAEFRNIHFESHAKALAALGGEEVPAIWDGERLYRGEADCRAFLAALADA